VHLASTLLRSLCYQQQCFIGLVDQYFIFVLYIIAVMDLEKFYVIFVIKNERNST
jgi:hypothetical protein